LPAILPEIKDAGGVARNRFWLRGVKLLPPGAGIPLIGELAAIDRDRQRLD
jgi:hypothetical protein